MQVGKGDLVEFGIDPKTVFICTRVWHHCLSLQEIGSNYPPSIMDHSHAADLIKNRKMRIISKA